MIRPLTFGDLEDGDLFIDPDNPDRVWSKIGYTGRAMSGGQQRFFNDADPVQLIAD